MLIGSVQRITGPEATRYIVSSECLQRVYFKGMVCYGQEIQPSVYL